MFEPFIVEAALLHYAGVEWHDPYWYMWFDRDRIDEVHRIPGLGTVKVVDCNLPKDISYAEHSEKVWMVFEIDGVCYRKSGSHTSYVGTEFEESMQIVKPVEKTVIVYEEAENTS